MTDRKKTRTPARAPIRAEPAATEPRARKSRRRGGTIGPTPTRGYRAATPAAPVLPVPQTPESAALEAARIVSEIIDIDTPTGAVIAAAAAAAAATEVKRAADGLPPQEQAISRDMILAAIAAEDSQMVLMPVAPQRRTQPIAVPKLEDDPAPPARASSEPAATSTPRAGSEPAAPDQVPAPSDPAPTRNRRAATDPGGTNDPITTTGTRMRRAATEPGAQPMGVVADDDFDPVQIAAAAIQRLRKRARTDIAELRGHYQRFDGVVIVLAFVIIVVVARIHAGLVTPPNVSFSKRGLTFEHSKAWLKPEPIAFPPARIVHDSTTPPTTKPSKDPEKDPYHVEFTSTIDPSARIEVLIDKKPAWSNIVTGLDLDRRSRWGELYKMAGSTVVDVEGHDWLRTEYTYAYSPHKNDAPRVDRAIEYATKDKDQLYVLTFFGSPRALSRMEEVIAPSLRVATKVGLQIEAQTAKLSRQSYPKPVGRAFESTVMVVVADLVDGRLRVKGGGSGVIVGGDGSILTAYHVIHDRDGRLHDVFVVGRFGEADKPPRLMCAGKPSRSKLQREVDLALVKCDMDLDGRPWSPASAPGVWQTLPEGRTSDVKMGQRLWVLGYPDVGGGGLTLQQGEVNGWTGVDGAQGRDYIKTYASIRSGNSGGPVIDDSGKLVGIAAAFRTRVTVTSVTETTQVGLVRPLSAASDLLAIAAAGWTPREGHTDIELAPVAVEAPAEGVHLSTRVLDAANEAPIAEALVMILRKGVSTSDVDVNRLDDQVLSWGRSNSAGEVLLKQPVPVPGRYSVMVVARGYEPLIGTDELVLAEDTPNSFDPWGKIWLRSR